MKSKYMAFTICLTLKNYINITCFFIVYEPGVCFNLIQFFNSFIKDGFSLNSA